MTTSACVATSQTMHARAWIFNSYFSEFLISKLIISFNKYCHLWSFNIRHQSDQSGQQVVGRFSVEKPAKCNYFWKLLKLQKVSNSLPFQNYNRRADDGFILRRDELDESLHALFTNCSDPHRAPTNRFHCGSRQIRHRDIRLNIREFSILFGIGVFTPNIDCHLSNILIVFRNVRIFFLK